MLPLRRLDEQLGPVLLLLRDAHLPLERVGVTQLLERAPPRRENRLRLGG